MGVRHLLSWSTSPIPLCLDASYENETEEDSSYPETPRQTGFAETESRRSYHLAKLGSEL
jgi:hypothetical protein